MILLLPSFLYNFENFFEKCETKQQKFLPNTSRSEKNWKQETVNLSNGLYETQSYSMIGR